MEICVIEPTIKCGARQIVIISNGVRRRRGRPGNIQHWIESGEFGTSTLGFLWFDEEGFHEKRDYYIAEQNVRRISL